MGKIVLLVSREEMLYQAHNILQEKKYNIAAMKVIRTEEAIVEARHAIADGASIIIARGLQASLIKQYTDIPVVEIVMTAQEMALLVMKAKQIVKKQHPVIAVIGTKNMFCDMSYFDTLYDIELRTYYAAGGESLKNAAKEAVEDGADLIIGGDTAVLEAGKGEIPSLFLATTEDAIRTAFVMAEHVDYAMESEKKSEAQMEALLDYSSNGVMRLDHNGTVLSVNPVMEQMMEQEEGRLAGRPLSDIFPEIEEEYVERIMEKGEENCSWFLQAGPNAVLATLAPVVVEGNAEGAIFTCHKIKKKAPERTKAARGRKAELIALGDFRDILQLSPNMQECIRKARLYSVSESPVVILGETGTEVRLIAQGIHNSSLRGSGPFLTVNCAGMTEEEQGREIFGEKGAVYVVNGGTLFLEDADALTLQSQYRLYQLLRNKIRISENSLESSRLDVRVILAFNRPLREAVQEGKLRLDLFYLLESLVLEIPPLCFRKEDLKQKISESLKAACERYSRYHVLTEGAWKKLMDCDWPGNFLQVESFIERLVLTAGKRVLDERNVEELYEELYSNTLYKGNDRAAESGGRICQTSGLNREAAQIREVLERNSGNRERTAKELGISKSTLWRRMKKYDLD